MGSDLPVTIHDLRVRPERSLLLHREGRQTQICGSKCHDHQTLRGGQAFKLGQTLDQDRQVREPSRLGLTSIGLVLTVVRQGQTQGLLTIGLRA